jgi:excisionase family DNA binding protein
MPNEIHEPSTPLGLDAQTGGCASTYRSVAELATDIGLSERSTRAALRRGEIPHIRVGRRFILPRAAVAEWLRTAGSNLESEAATPRPAKRVAVFGGQR